MNSPALVDEIRTASRLMVRELGFMSTTLAATAWYIRLWKFHYAAR